MIETECKQCDKTIKVFSCNFNEGRGNFCSVKCFGKFHSGNNNSKWSGGKIKRICQECGNEFSIVRAWIKNGGGKYCSRKCYGLFKSQYNKKLGKWVGDSNPAKTERVKEIISKCNKGKTPWNKGIPRTLEERKKMSDWRKGRQKGNENPNWKGGKKIFYCMNCKKKIEDYDSQRKNKTQFCSNKCKGIYYTSYTQKSNMKIELLIGEELNKRKINNIPQKGLFDIAVADFFLPESNIAIFCDGDYWHRLPGRQENDKIRTRKLEYKGIKVFRFWEKDIINSPKLCMDEIKI